MLVLYPVTLALAVAAYGWYFFFGAPNMVEFSSRIHGDLGDPLFVLWMFEKNVQNFLASRFVFDGGIFFPNDHWSLLFSDAMLLSTACYQAIAAWMPQKIAAYHCVLLAFLVADFAAMYRLARLFFGRVASVFSGMVFGMSVLRAGMAVHAHLLPQFPLPLIALHLFRFHQTRKPSALIWAGSWFALQFYLSASLGMLTVLALLPYTVWVLVREVKDPRFWKAAGLSGAGVGLLLSPLGFHYWKVGQQYQLHRELYEVRIYSAHITNYLLVPAGHPYEPWLASRKFQKATFGRSEKQLFVGFLALIAAIFGFRALGRRPKSPLYRARWLILGSTLFVMWLSLGPQAHLYTLFHHYFPGVSGIRTPGRLGLFYLFGVAWLAGAGAQAAWERAGARRWWLALLAFSFFAFENQHGFRYLEVPSLYGGVSRKLAEIPGEAPVLFLPVEHQTIVKMWAALRHTHPLVNGYSGYFPEPYAQVLWWSEAPGREALNYYRQLGVRLLVLEKKEISKLALPGWQEALELVKAKALYEDEAVQLFELSPALPQ